jgi:hypothetical protein
MRLIPFGVLSAAGAGGGPSGGGAYELIQSSILTSDTASVTFSSIPEDYKHLQIRMVSRNPTNTGGALLRINGDTGSNYVSHRIYGFGGSVTSSALESATNVDLIAFTSASLSSSTDFGAGVIDILDYTNTSKNTTIRGLGGREQGNGSTSDFIVLLSGLWINTSAVTSVSLTSEGTFQTGSRFSLYGIRGE